MVLPGGVEGVGGSNHQLGGVPDGQVTQLFTATLLVHAGLCSGCPAGHKTIFITHEICNKSLNTKVAHLTSPGCVAEKMNSLGRRLGSTSLFSASASNSVGGSLWGASLPTGGGRKVIE